MLSPISATVGICCIGYAALNAYAQPGSAVSAEAKSVTEAASDLMRSAEDSQSIFIDKIISISQLAALANECNEQGWDGYDASPLDALAILNAENFLRALPKEPLYRNSRRSPTDQSRWTGFNPGIAYLP